MRQVLVGGLLGTLTLAAVGCGEMTNHSIESRKQGIELYNTGQYADATGSFRNALRQDPSDYKAYYYLGRSQQAQGAMQESIQAYKSALDTIDLTVEGRSDKAFKDRILDGLANAIATSSFRDSEIDKLLAVAKANPSAQTYVLLARIYRDSKDADSAVEAYHRATLLDPASFEVKKEYGLYLESLGQQQNAQLVLREAYKLNGNDTQVNTALRRLGIIPGPSIKDENQLNEPIIPLGPIPQVRLPGQERNAPTPGAAENARIQQQQHTEPVQTPQD